MPVPVKVSITGTSLCKVSGAHCEKRMNAFSSLSHTGLDRWLRPTGTTQLAVNT